MNKTGIWYLHCAISLSIMIFFRFIPAPPPMTAMGMTVLGLFLGAIYGWITTNLIWPSIAALMLVGFTGALTPANAWGTLFGNGLVELCFWLMLAVGLLQNSGAVNFLARWSITRKFYFGKPWAFIITVFVVDMACGSVLGAPAAILAFFPLVWAICDEVGFEKRGRESAWMTFTVVVFSGIAGFLLPFQTTVISNFAFLAAGSNGAYDGSFNYSTYLCFSLIMTTIIFVVYMLFSKYVWKIDLAKLRDYKASDADAITATKKQKIGLVLFLILFVALMLPSFLPAGTEIAALANRLGSVGSCMIIACVSCLLRVDGEAFISFRELIDGVSWELILMFGTALVIANIINTPEAGVVLWVKDVMQPIFGTMSGFGFVVCFMLIAVVLTNLVNNIVVEAIMLPIAYMLCMTMNLNPIALVVCFILFVDFAFLLPSSSPVGALLHSASTWISRSRIYSWGSITLVILVSISLVIGWPLANLLF